MKSHSVFCPNCSSRIGAENINVHEFVGKCEGCDHVFPLNLRRIRPNTESPGPEPSQPSGVVIDRGWDRELLIVRRWFEPGLFGLLFFCIVWDGFLVFWYSMVLFGMEQRHQFEWMPVLFPLLHVATGVWMTYYVIAGFFNESVICTDWELFWVRHGPVPWYGNRDLLIEEIQGFEVDLGHSTNNQPSYSLSAHVDDGRKMVLVAGLQLRQAQYIGWHLANYLSVPLSESLSHPQPVQSPGGSPEP